MKKSTNIAVIRTPVELKQLQNEAAEHLQFRLQAIRAFEKEFSANPSEKTLILIEHQFGVWAEHYKTVCQATAHLAVSLQAANGIKTLPQLTADQLKQWGDIMQRDKV